MWWCDRGAGASAGDVVAGAAAGAVATCATYPFDFLRTRLAAQGVPKVRVNAVARSGGVVAAAWTLSRAVHARAPTCTHAFEQRYPTMRALLAGTVAADGVGGLFRVRVRRRRLREGWRRTVAAVHAPPAGRSRSPLLLPRRVTLRRASFPR